MPSDTALLQGLNLTDADQELLADFTQRTSLRVEELRQGLRIEVGPHIGVVALSQLRIHIVPKLQLDHVMAMVSAAFELTDLLLIPNDNPLASTEQGFVDLLALSLLQGVRNLVRQGLLKRYQPKQGQLNSPRGRIDLRQVINRPRQTQLYCQYHDLTGQHVLNQIVAEGLRLSASIVQSASLHGDLLSTANRYFGAIPRLDLNGRTLATAQAVLDRQSRHYAPLLQLVALLAQGSGVGLTAGGVSVGGFLLDMNRAFERFLTRYLQTHTPPGMRVVSQDSRADVFAYLDNPQRWRQPAIRPDFVFIQQGKTRAIGDAKYQDHTLKPPTTPELYQLVTYALAYPMPEPREVFLFYPLATGEQTPPGQLLFKPDGLKAKVLIRLLGVPIEELLRGSTWWPLSAGLT
jgi:5-methylcytosine-specific restriction endonuclease McrBC regulatory subunit McrC